MLDGKMAARLLVHEARDLARLLLRLVNSFDERLLYEVQAEMVAIKVEGPQLSVQYLASVLASVGSIELDSEDVACLEGAIHRQSERLVELLYLLKQG